MLNILIICSKVKFKPLQLIIIKALFFAEGNYNSTSSQTKQESIIQDVEVLESKIAKSKVVLKNSDTEKRVIKFYEVKNKGGIVYNYPILHKNLDI